jgi:predicted ATP-grasp superfamily ATP-dependent carboligase
VTRSVLLVSTATRWLGTARMPRVLARAGFDVALLAPRDSLATKSRYVSRTAFLSESATPVEWLLRLIQVIDTVSPELLVPCDEMAVRLLFALAVEPPPGFKPALRARLVSLITSSLGDPRFYEPSIDKTMLPAAADTLGIPVPPYALATRIDDAINHAATLGYPVVLKRRFGFAGQGVAVVSTREELTDAAQRLLRPDQLDLGEHREPQLLVQAFITGPYRSQALVALRGEPLASFGWERHVATTPVKGQTSVLRFVRSPETRAFSEALCRGFGIGGFFNVQFVVDERTGDAYLLEINRRIVTHTHLGERVGQDLGRALLRALEGKPAEAAPTVDEAVGGTVVIFPREWLRDPGSRHLAEFPSDVPWDDPELVAAMFAMRHEE